MQKTADLQRFARPVLLALALVLGAVPAVAQPGIPQPTCKAAGSRQSLDAPPPRPLEPAVRAKGRIKDVLDRRKTVNVAGPWLDRSKNPVKNYGVVWHNWLKHPGGNTIFLREIYWAFRSTDLRDDAFRFYGPELERYLTDEHWPTLEEYGSTYRLAFNKPGFPAFIANAAERTLAATGADGVLLDLWIDEMPAFPVERVRKSRIALAKELRRRIGPDPVIMGNVGWTRDRSTHEYLNGVFVELWKNPSDRGYSCKELLLMEELLAFHDRHLSQPKIVVFEPWRITRDPEGSDRKNATNRRWAELFTAMAAVVPRNGYILYSDNARDRSEDDHGHAFYDIYRTDLGRPTSGPTPIARGVAYRMFSKGLISYNATPREVEVTIAGSRVVLPALSGVFCRQSGGRLDCEQ